MPTIQPKLHTNKPLADGSYSVKLYIYDEIQEQDYWYSLGYSCHKNQWNNEARRFRKNYPNYKDKNRIVSQKELQAHKIVDGFTLNGDRFDILKFREQMNGRKKKSITLLDHYKEQIYLLDEQAIKDHKKAKSGKVWKETRNLLVRFIEQSSYSLKMPMDKLDVTFLKDLEHYMKSRGNADSTISIRMRNIRKAWNILGDQNIIDKNIYPFGKGKYQIGKLNVQQDDPNPLNEEQVEKWKQLDVDDRLERSKMYALGSYFLNGSNFIDLALLRKSKNIKNGRVSYNRSKNGTLITIKITPEIQKIFDFFASDSDYLFDILREDKHKTGTQKRDRADKIERQTNEDLKVLAKMVGKEPTGFTFYNFRDTFAYKLHKSGVDVRLIQQAIGHKRIQQTLTYLSKFGNEEVDDLAKYL